MTIGRLPVGTKGFDCNTRVTIGAAQKFKAAGYQFAIRYVRRAVSHSFDITAIELTNLLQAGLSVMLVQHVGNVGWRPAASLGQAYGLVAAEHAKMAGYPLGCTLWCDLEGVSSSSTSLNVIGYCNAWYDQVKSWGYVPGLYVGDRPGLTARQLYHALRFQAYWAAYNLDLDLYPAVRGIQLRQKAYPPAAKRVEGISFEYDEDVVLEDSLGGSPIFCLAPKVVP